MLQPSLPYNLVKFSLQMFNRTPQKLDKDEYEKVNLRAKEECTLQKKILGSKEGLKVVVPEKSLEEAMDAIAGRYESIESFKQDLAENNLDIGSMKAALEVDLIVDATMGRVAALAEPPGEEQVEELFETAEKEIPEQRCPRHILITINEQFPENFREAALARIQKIRAKALVPGTDFGELAQHYSECPSALQGGSFRPVTRGTIFPSLEETLFAMEVGEISDIVESAMGFHILFCEKVIMAKKLASDEVKDKIRRRLHTQLKKKKLKNWLATL